MDRIECTKDTLRDELIANFPGAPAEVTDYINGLVETANRHRGDWETMDPYLDMAILATV